MSWELGMRVARIKSGERHRFQIGDGDPVEISYYERQAYGDNGEPVPGDTVGEFTVYWSPDKDPYRGEDIHVGPGPAAKPYHAEQIASRMIRRVPLDRRHRKDAHE